MSFSQKPVNYKEALGKEVKAWADDVPRKPDSETSKFQSNGGERPNNTTRNSYSPQKPSNPTKSIGQRSYTETSHTRMLQIQAYVRNRINAQKNIEMFTNNKSTLNIEMGEVDLKLMTDNMSFFIKDYNELMSKINHFEKVWLHKLNIFQTQILWKALMDKKIKDLPFVEDEVKPFENKYDGIPTLEDAIDLAGEYYP